MSLISCYARRFSRVRPSRYLSSPRWISPGLRLVPPACRRYFNDGGLTLAIEEELADQDKLRGKVDQGVWNEYRSSFNAPQPTFEFQRCIPSRLISTTVTAVGFLGKPKNMGASMTFVNLEGGNGPERIQLLARAEFGDDARRALRHIRPNSAVSVTGTLHWKYEAKDKKDLGSPEEGTEFINNLEIRIQSIKTLNTFSRPLHPGSMLDPKERDLHIRFDKDLRQRLKFRSDVAAFARQELADFQEVETPILFKSTPEGAREFLVPTRNRGMAYGLPQSPQQYKQILMACGINRYAQFAKCFRDEDHRADRQPEFTQIDLEMAWADGEAVIQRVEQFVKALWREFAGRGAIKSSLPDTPFVRMTYDEAMSKHGSDKPDLRIPGEIHRIDQIIPADLRGMLTSIEDPIVEAFKIKLDVDSKSVQKFIREFMDSADAEPFKKNVDGAPGIFVFNSRKPLEGLQGFGFEGAESLKSTYSGADGFEDGDLLLVQARPNLPHSGGATLLGKLRLAIYKAAVARNLINPDRGHHFLWVTDFPMFTPDNSTDPGQGGSSGFSATHHPFTAPKSSDDLDMLLIDPLKAKADHYDLVLNGVELGGGSQRIHSSAIQKFIMKDILKMPSRRMDDFKHLFRALEAGCPPHAGLAIGFDRLIAVMQGRDSVRDVIAFPKNSNGEDPMVESPSPINQKQLQNYHLKVSHKDRLEALREKQEAEFAKMRELKAKKREKVEGEDAMADPLTANEVEHLQEYLDSLKVLAPDRTETTMDKSPSPTDGHMQQYLDHLKVLPRDRTKLIPWTESPKSAIMIGEPFSSEIMNDSQNIAAAIKRMRTQLESRATVMVNDTLDPIRSDVGAILKPTLQTLLLHYDRGNLQIQDMTGFLGESMLIGVGLEKEMAKEKRGKAMWGVTDGKLEKMTREKLEKALSDGEQNTTKGEVTTKEKAERPSDSGDLSDAAQAPR